MDKNAIETWLARMHRHALVSGNLVHWYYHVQIAKPGALEEQFEVLSNCVVRSKYSFSETWSFFFEFYRMCRSSNFDVVHVHADIMSAPYLVAAWFACRAKLIVHIHNPDETIPSGREWKKWLLREPLRLINFALADKIVGISNHTLDTFLSGRKRRPGRDLIHYYGIDAAPFLGAKCDRSGFRRVLGLADDSLILLFCGRIVAEKNPLFAVEVFAEMKRSDTRVVCVFVGSGSLESKVLSRITELGLDSSFRYLAWRNDIPDIMCCCDWFILARPEFPQEGLGIAVVEAQLAGLHLIISRGISVDALLPTASALRLSLALTPTEWAASALAMVHHDPHPRQAALADLAASPFAMDTALEALLKLHN
jgi:glycosyltransferase involved in cell wall biosynthesis